jgi:histidinol phosphatase-like enzyme
MDYIKVVFVLIVGGCPEMKFNQEIAKQFADMCEEFFTSRGIVLERVEYNIGAGKLFVDVEI